MKKIIKIIFCIFLFILLFLILSFYTNVKHYHDGKVLDGYTDNYDCSIDIGMDYVKYRKYYYEQKDDDRFINNSDYVVVDDDNIGEIKELFDIMEIAFYKEKECKSNINPKIISLGDYVSINRPDKYYEALKNGCKEKESYCSGEHNFKLYYYDIDTHVLHYMANKN